VGVGADQILLGDRQVGLDRKPGAQKALRHYPDDPHWMAVQTDGPPQHPGVTAEGAAPEGGGEDGRGLGAQPIVLGPQGAALLG